MKKKSRNLIILSVLSVLALALIAGVAAICIKMMSYTPPEPSEPDPHAQEILFSDEINLLIGQKIKIAPYFMDTTDGSISSGRFTYESNCAEIEVDPAGNVTAKGVPTGEAYITISDTKSTEKKQVRVYVNDGLVDVLYVENENGERLKDDGTGNMGTQKFENVFSEAQKEYVFNFVTKPATVEIGDFCEVTVVGEKDVLEVSFSGNTMTVKPTGVGLGELNIKVEVNVGGNEETLFDGYMTFDIGVSNSSVYNAIMDSAGGKTLLTKSEVESIKEITVDSAVTNMNNLSMLKSLERLYINSSSVVNMRNLNSRTNIEYFVPYTVFDQYRNSNTWNDYHDILTPYDVTDENARYIVYHNILSNDIEGYAEINSSFKLLVLDEQNGLKFVGWTDKNGNLLDVDAIKRAEGSIHVYSKWRNAQYTVYYHLRAFNKIVEEVHEVDERFYLKSVTSIEGYKPLPGKTFIGWTLSSKSEPTLSDVVYRPNQEVINLAYTDGAEVHLYDVWDTMEYTIRFVIPEDLPFSIYDSFYDITLKYGEEYNLPEMSISEPGYVFKGWKTPGGKILNPGVNTTPLTEMDGETVTLTAVIEGIPAYLVFKFGGGTLVSAPANKEIKDGALVEIKYGEEMVLPLLSQAGKTFKGWMIEGNLYEAGDEFVQYHNDPNANKLYYVEAIWE